MRAKEACMKDHVGGKEMSTTPIEVFYAYVDVAEDERLRGELDKHLSLLQRQGIITTWYPHKIGAGADWSQVIDRHLNSASVILLLISPAFLASDYCYGVEMNRALERHEASEARVVPILMRSVDWKSAPFVHLQALPTDGTFVTSWQNQDEALTNVAAGLRRTIEDLSLLTASASRAALPALWNLPYARNSFFLGRDDLLSRLRMQLQADQATALSQPQAISGLGGIGKTQLAVEYAYRFHRDYQAVLWARAESQETLSASYIALATLLPLPQRGE